VLERGIDQPDGLTYSIPQNLADLEPGERVRAPLGRGNAPAEGYIVEILTSETELGGLAPGKIKALLGRSSKAKDTSKGRFPQVLMQLAVWMAQYYCCPIGMVIGAMVPAAVKRQTGAVEVKLLQPVADADRPEIKLTKGSRQVWDGILGLDLGDFPMPTKDLAARLRLRTVAPLQRLVRAGLLIESVRDGIRSSDGPKWEPTAGEAIPHELSEDQRRAVEGISARLGEFRPHLLRGVTGSGKTEVYLQVLSRVIDRGESAIVLVPEISLTPQTAGRFLARFGGAQGGLVSVMHSGLSASQRNRAWSRVASGEARIVVGARSAVFAPIAGKLGLIIVDEEHDGSYKQDQLPRYHGRDVALRRGQLEGCPVILGSATPSLESWHNALPKDAGGAGRFELHELPRRVGGGVMPKVEILDMVEEERRREPQDRRLSSIGPTLRDAIRETLKGTGQIILLLNRRGYASYIHCPDQSCGWYMTCKHCDVTAVHHRLANRGHGESGGNIVRCHHCLAEQKLPTVCPACAKRVSTFGFGTQRVEEELERLFSTMRSGETMLRLDSDSMNRVGAYFSALDRFRRGEVRMLLGTQMIAKGLDFPNVELIGVINADTALAMPDFRAEERTFQLISQVAGRAGRGVQSGGRSRVLVQTFNPGAPSIGFAAKHDYTGFAMRELVMRRETGLPPIGRMVRIVCRDVDAGKAEGRAREVVVAIRGLAGIEAVRVKGPMACPIARIGDHYRFGIELLAGSAGPLQMVLAELRTLGLVRSDAKTAVDVDPVVMV